MSVSYGIVRLFALQGKRPSFSSQGAQLSKLRPQHRRSSPSSHSSRPVTTAAISSTEHANFIQDAGGSKVPKNLGAMLAVLEAQAQTIVQPTDRVGLVPLVIPLSRDVKGKTTALLRWPTPPEGMEMPVVRADENGLFFLANSIDQYIHRALAEDDVKCVELGVKARVVAEAAGSVGLTMYKSGDVAASPYKRLDVYLMKQVGKFPDVFERLALSHLGKNDQISALVTAEYYNNRQFPGWGRPSAFLAELYQKIGRQLECRDAARMALRSPWWTLGTPFEVIANLAEYGRENGIKQLRERISEEAALNDAQQGKAPAQIALDRAAFTMDIAVAEKSWPETLPRLAELYKEGGMPDVAKLVLA
eukprot:jgi/Mesvir1/10750/Mv13819-RA.1